ncbi:acetate--CoA ligase family protein [Candidatus Microgenomates bacterium]|nr:acetate--CoA ligase family protein [Candidatus Microgenomates bacterium]
MKLYEFEGKNLFKKVGIATPRSFLVSNPQQFEEIPVDFVPVVVKVQALSGNRAARGGIVRCTSLKEIKANVQNFLGSDFGEERVSSVLVEEEIHKEKEYYLSVTFDTSVRSPVLLISTKGGTGVATFEERFILDPFEDFTQEKATRLLKNINFPPSSAALVVRLVGLFYEYDCRLAEINPLTWDGYAFWALDAKVILDDAALYRHPDLSFSPRSSSGKPPTKAEIDAHTIDENDHRGVAGSVYFDLDGDIGILASGGGGSLVALDGVLSAGGKPANYTEYSGNPPFEKVYALTTIVLSKRGLHGLLIAGAIANFTDIQETLRGVLQALRDHKPHTTFPIVIRRAGPRDKEAFEMLRDAGQKEGFDLHLFGEETPIDTAAKLVVEFSKKHH